MWAEVLLSNSLDASVWVWGFVSMFTFLYLHLSLSHLYLYLCLTRVLSSSFLKCLLFFCLPEQTYFSRDDQCMYTESTTTETNVIKYPQNWRILSSKQIGTQFAEIKLVSQALSSPHSIVHWITILHCSTISICEMYSFSFQIHSNTEMD